MALSCSKKFVGIIKIKNRQYSWGFYCLNCFHAYTTKNKLESHKKVCKNHDYCSIEMSNENNKILKYNHQEKSMRAPFIIYADLESLLEKMDTRYDSPEKSSTTKINKQTPSGYSLFTYCLFDKTKNKLSRDRGKNSMKNFLTGKYRGAAHNICNLRYKTLKEIPIVFHNGSTYHYHFIVMELAEEFEGEFKCLGENTEKYITFLVTITKEIIKKDKNGNDKITKISYKIKFTDSYRFMSTSLSKLIDKLSEDLHNDKCKDCKSYLDYVTIKDNHLIFRCFSCK